MNKYILLGVDAYFRNTLARRMQRLLIGSISRRVMQFAPCPVVQVVAPLPERRARGLIGWYMEAVAHSLHEHSGSLLIFTACDVAQRFAPPTSVVGIKEVEAATHALERLVSTGVLCRRTVKGELCYLND